MHPHSCTCEGAVNSIEIQIRIHGSHSMRPLRLLHIQTTTPQVCGDQHTAGTRAEPAGLDGDWGTGGLG